MTKLAKARSEFEWDKEIKYIEKTPLHKHEAGKLYEEKKLRDGEVFALRDAKILRPGRLAEEDAWSFGVFVKGKFLHVTYPLDDRRLKRLKRQAVARLYDIVKTGMVDTRQDPLLPPRYQSLRNPDFVLFGKTNLDTDHESHTMAETKQVFDESAPVVRDIEVPEYGPLA